MRWEAMGCKQISHTSASKFSHAKGHNECAHLQLLVHAQVHQLLLPIWRALQLLPSVKDCCHPAKHPFRGVVLPLIITTRARGALRGVTCDGRARVMVVKAPRSPQ